MERAGEVGDRLSATGLRLSVAESCTGGLLAARLTERPGASRFFAAAVVAYSDAAKTALLGVEPATLRNHGAVSEEVVRAMAEGVRRMTASDASLAITGVAGPEGGTPEKPVGTVWIAATLADRSEARSFEFAGGRAAIRESSAREAVELLLFMLDAS